VFPKGLAPLPIRAYRLGASN